MTYYETMTTIIAHAQSASPSGKISLFTLDTSKLGGGVFPFVQASTHDGPVTFNGVEYTAADVKFEGLETSGVGALPTPKITVANSGGIFQAMINTWGDLTGCTLHRIKTFARYLDDGAEPDPSAFYGPDTFRIERKALENGTQIEWELSAAIDQQGKKLPGRQVISDTCLWRYRLFNPAAGTFDYSKAQCPYTGSVYYDINDQPVANPADDVPSRRLSCCRARFGRKNPLPFGGFPGAGRSQL